MKKDIPQILLFLTFLLRIMIPIGNAAYLMCMLSTGKDSVWKMIYVVAVLAEIALMLAVGAGFRFPKARRVGAYGAFALVIIHFVAFMGLYVFHPACRQVLTPLYMILFTLASILMLSFANGSLLSVAEMSVSVKESAPQEEASEIL